MGATNDHEPASTPDALAGGIVAGGVASAAVKEESTPLLQTVITMWIIGGIVLVVIGSDSSESAGSLQRLVSEHWLWLLPLYVALLFALVIGLRVPWIRDRARSLSPVTRSTLITALLIPVVPAVLATGAVSPPWQPVVIRSLFVLILCLLPASMYYLFILSRRPSMLNEYIANLERMGLIPREPPPKGLHDRDMRRIESYLQRFEAVYGPVVRKDRDKILAELGGAGGRTSGRSLGALAYGGETTQLLPREVLLQLFVTTLLFALGWMLVLPPVLGPAAADTETPWRFGLTAESLAAMTPQLSPVSMAFLGAYLFSLLMIFKRFVRKDLSVKAYVNTSVRTAIAIIAAWVLTVAMAADGLDSVPAKVAAAPTTSAHWLLLLLAFVCGAFPRTLWDMIAAPIRKAHAHVKVPSMEPGQPLGELEGLTVWHEARFEEEDIENVPNLATADPIDLILQTRISPERLMHWIDQAILLRHFPQPKGTSGEAAASDLVVLRRHGITTASELYVCCRNLDQAELERMVGPALTVRLLNILAGLRSRDSTFTLVRNWYGLSRRLVPSMMRQPEAQAREIDGGMVAGADQPDSAEEAGFVAGA